MDTYRRINMFRVSKKANSTASTFILLGGLLMVAYLCTDFNEGETTYLTSVAAKQNRSSINSYPRCQQNISAAGIPGFGSLSREIQDFLYHRHCRHFPMILDLPDKCGGDDNPEDVFLLLVIKSPPTNYERREVLRKTWAKEKLHRGMWIRRVFLSGTLSDGLHKEKMNKLLEVEHREHKDILQWDFYETFFNLTLKQILFLEWMERNCNHARFLLNGDDDVLANTDNIVEYLDGLGSYDWRKHLFTGHLISGAGPIRRSTSKYYIPVQVYEPSFYPPYCGGAGYLLSGYTALAIYHTSESVPLLPIDDVYIAMCLAKANLQPTSHTGVKTLDFTKTLQKVQNDPCILKELLLVHNFPPAFIYVIWYQLHEANLTCGYHTEIY
ncbi:N-acetyllactosaminide beta-1,3-N-acetylglucosaminyltransferase 3-like [Salarias fasciatus]|uniref:Hexosyltransferase n=1 Tax=Salarias fasciatus TaxID=181472 RepID=A0A672JBX1_SALFA|nr:N-acetyllactosaminide beta-1,3-N-acetylglucosaminyltransferase 3-like [Salarias fasciatus]